MGLGSWAVVSDSGLSDAIMLGHDRPTSKCVPELCRMVASCPRGKASSTCTQSPDASSLHAWRCCVVAREVVGGVSPSSFTSYCLPGRWALSQNSTMRYPVAQCCSPLQTARRMTSGPQVIISTSFLLPLLLFSPISGWACGTRAVDYAPSAIGAFLSVGEGQMKDETRDNTGSPPHTSPRSTKLP